MATAVPLDLSARAPSAVSLARAAGALRGEVGPWDPRAFMGHGLEKVEGLSRLMAVWASWREAGRLPGDELRNALLQRWPQGSCEHDLVAEALRDADLLGHVKLVRDETTNLRQERAATPDVGEVAYYDLLLSCLSEMKKVAKLKDAGGEPRFAAHPDTLEAAQWTMHNLLRFLQAHWALRKVHGRVAGIIAKRRAAIVRLSGILEGPGDMADSHDEIS